MEASGAWVAHLSEKYHRLTLYKLAYNMVWLDGSLRWSRVEQATRVGELYEPGMQGALFDRALAEQRRAQRLASSSCGLLSGDPLKQPSMRGRGSKGGGRSQRQNRSRSRGTAQPDLQSATRAAHGAIADEPPLNDPLPHEPSRDAETTEAAAAAEIGLGEEFDLFDLDAEVAGLIGDDLDELMATYGDGPVVTRPSDPDNEMDITGPVAEPLPHDFADRLADEAETAGLLEEGQGDNSAQESRPGADGAANSASPTTLGAEEALAPPLSVWERLSVSEPSPMGYVCHEGKTILRIQRGKPRGNLSVKCYRHPGCSFLLGLARAPPDNEIVEWAFEVPPRTDGTTPAEAKAMAKQHMQLADRWRPKKGPAASSSAAGSNAA